MDDDNRSISSENYDSIKENAVTLLGLVNKYVKVRLIKDSEFVGFVHSIDPVQHSIILLQPQENSYIINILPGHAVLEVEVTQPGLDCKLPQYKKAIQREYAGNCIRKKKLVSWFKKNLLQITESEEKILFGNVSILPPYGVSNICTDNPVVAMQLRKVIEKMPQDFESEN